MLADEVAGSVVIEQPGRLHGGGVVVVAAVEEGLAIGRERIACAVDLRVPVITGEQLVGALAALHHFAVLGHLPRQQVEGNAVVADHRLAHGAESCRQLLDDLPLVDAQLMMTGAVMAGDQVGVLELVATLAAGILEADGKGR
ncbi:hypothetical protein D3C77_510320 [compost metagenome]